MFSLLAPAIPKATCRKGRPIPEFNYRLEETMAHQSTLQYTVGRIGIASLFIVSGILKAASFSDTAAWMSSSGLPFASALLVATLALEIGGGFALAAGIRTRMVAVAFAAFLVPATLLFHQFWAVSGEASAEQLNHFLKNFALLGAMLVLAATASPQQK